MTYEITTLGHEIAVYRDLEGLNQEDFADLLGVARTTVSKWEQNKVIPRPSKIRSLIQMGVLTKARARDLVARAKSGYPVGRFSTPLSLSVPKKLLDRGVRFGLNFTRPGPNDPAMFERDPINAIQYFEPVPGRGRSVLRTEVRQSKPTGFQFKCFADYANMSFEDVAKALVSVGYECDDRPGEGEQGRLWFLDPDFTIIQTPDGIFDNFCYPQ